MFEILFILCYFLAVYRLDQFYLNRYFWDNNCKLERVLTSFIQPFMELFANGMTAHFWHFEDLDWKTNSIEKKYFLELNNFRPPFRIFDKGKFLAILTAAWVDCNPWQTCAIIRPKNYKGKWKIFFPLSSNICQEEKCSHYGRVKVVIDGKGNILGRDLNGNFIELEVLGYCLAFEKTHILFV